MVQDQNLTPEQKNENKTSETPALNLLSELLEFDAQENPQKAFFILTNCKAFLRKKDLMDATGLSRRKIDKIFDNQYSQECRRPKFDKEAIYTLSEHLERPDLSLHQWLFSNLLWKQLSYFAMMDILNQLEILIGPGGIEALSKNEDFDLDTYCIDADELEEAMGYLMVHIMELIDGSEEAA